MKWYKHVKRYLKILLVYKQRHTIEKRNTYGLNVQVHIFIWFLVSYWPPEATAGGLLQICSEPLL